MGQNVDTTTWATFSTAVGILTVAHELWQFAMAMLTLVSGIIAAHFLKRALNYYFPPKKRAEQAEKE